MAVESKTMDHIRKVLEEFGDKYLTKDGALKRNTVIEDLDNYDKDLMTAILKDDLLHETYTSKIADVEIFELNKFVDMLRYKEYWEDSFTKYNNKIGLTAVGRYIDDSSDVVLDFPYKDCVLKAGMTKEDVEHSGDADEPFLNETLAKPEIDELLEPKIFVNATKYDQNGGLPASCISDEDNLIIKGNNLIALHTISKIYAGKVKLIYIDPPYNTGSDSFVYNDKFNHSAWLTFMKNRLEIAKDLLSLDGMIFVQTDDKEHAYLKVLMDSIFKNKYLNTIVIKAKSSSGASGGGEDKKFKKNVEFILVYANSEAKINIQKKPFLLSDYIKERKTEGKTFAYTNVLVNKGILKKIGETEDGRGKKIELFDVKNYEIKSVSKLAKDENISQTDVYKKYINEIFTTENAQTSIRDRVRNAVQDDGYTIARYKPVSGKNKGKVIEVGFIGKTKRLVSFLSSTTYMEEGDIYKTEKAGTLWDDISWSSIKNEGGVEFPSGKKPEKLLQRIISSSTSKNDLVLDFFMGSGSTQATALKMGRRFIGMEQIDSQIKISLKRLKNVISGEQSGISKKCNWHGGGSFVYAELMEKNQGYLKDLQNAKDIDDLMSVYARMKQNGDIDFRVDLDKFESSLKAGELPSFSDRKKELIKIIDKNQLYYNYSNIDDANVKDLISDSDYKFNKSFYSSNEEGKEY